MGCELNAMAMSHLEEISETGIKDMAKTGSVAVILPTTAYLLHLKPPPVRAMIDAGVVVALGTDFNPNAYCLSMVSGKTGHLSGTLMEIVTGGNNGIIISLMKYA